MMHMNNSPFYRTHWSAMPTMPSQSRHNYNQPPSKVVSIPVHFVGSERSRPESATKIQKLLRGFLVRKTMKKIAAVRVEVERIEKMVSAPETAELIRRDDRERIRLNETIMNLLLRLDSVRTLHSEGIRDCRKRVIKKAIALQDTLDQMVGHTSPVQGCDKDQAVQSQDDARPIEHSQEIPDSNCASSEMLVADSENGMKMEIEAKEDEDGDRDDLGPTSTVQDLVRTFHPEDGAADSNSCPIEHSPKILDFVGASSEMLAADSENGDGVKMDIGAKEDGEHGDCEGGVSKREEESVGTTMGEEIEESNGLAKSEKREEESVGTTMGEEIEESNGLVKSEKREEEEGCVEEELCCKGDRRREEFDEGKNRELLEKMIEDNERMMGMMAQLFEKNELQTRLLSSLSHRVEQLEREFACEKLRRKKRRNAIAADAIHKEPDRKSCI